MNKKINFLKNLSKEKEKDHTIEGKIVKQKIVISGLTLNWTEK